MEKFDKAPVGAIEETRPTVADLHGGNLFAQAAKKYWLTEKPAKFKPEALKTEFYDPLEKDGFRFRSLLILENLQFLEKFVPRVAPSWTSIADPICVRQVPVAQFHGNCVESPCRTDRTNGERQEAGEPQCLGYIIGLMNTDGAVNR